MLDAFGPNRDLEFVYRLCVEHPPALMLQLYNDPSYKNE